MITCYSCKNTKENEFFTKSKGKYRTLCKSCKSITDRKYREANREELTKKKQEYYQNNRDEINNKRKQQYLDNKQKYIDRSKQWKKNNSAKWNAKCMERYTDKLNRSADWDKELSELVFQEAYDLAKVRESLFDFKWHVDHIVPLRGKTVCGLHVWSNIAVIPASENCSKAAKYWPDMPCQI